MTGAMPQGAGQRSTERYHVEAGSLAIANSSNRHVEGHSSAKRDRGPRWLGNAIVLVCSLALSLCAIELLLRWHFYGDMAQPDYSAGFLMPDASIGWRLRPNAMARHQELDFNVPVTINSKGLREPERSYAKDPKMFRILLVSDSATFAS